jgi:peptide/nickel transport system substrate-binding protein
MKKKLYFFLAVGIVFLLAFSGCSGKDKQASQNKAIRIAEQVPNLITPGVWDGQAFSLDSSIYEYLVDIDTEGNLVPALATSWETPDGKVWTIKLREGVKFHDGSDFDSQDVKFTIMRTQDPTVGHLKAQDFSVVDSVETPDKHTVVINLKEVRPTFIYQMTDYNMAILSSSYDYAKSGETKPMGTGPFKLEKLIQKESAKLVRNKNYWDKDYPLANELLIYFVPDIDSSVEMLEAGKVDIVPQVTPLIKQRLEKADGFKVVSPYQEQRFLSMASDRTPFNDNRVRLALKYAMDPEILAKACQGTLNTDVFYNETPIMNSLAQYHMLPSRGRDIEKAKSLLAQAGYPNGLSVELYYASDHPYSPALAQTVKELAEPAGFNIQLKGYPRDVYLSQYWMNAPLSITGWGGRIDPSVLLNLAFTSQGPWNESHINDQEVDQIITKILKEVDDSTRQTLYDRLQEVFYERGTLINVQVPYLVAMKDTVEDYRQPITMLPQLKYAHLKDVK